MRHTDLELFISLFSYHNLSEAAASSGFSQPRATQVLQRLEKEIGCALFTRSHLGLEPTSGGLEFKPYAERILVARADGMRAAHEAFDGVLGSLHVGVSHTTSVFTIPHIMREFHRAFPNVRLKLTRAFPAQLLHGMQTDLFDVCLCFKPIRTAPYIWDTLFSTDLVGIYAPSFEPKVEAELKNFARLPLVLPSQRCNYRLLLDTELQKLGVEPSILMEIDDANSLLSMVRHGTAVSIVPRAIVKPRLQLRITSLKHPQVFAEVGIVTRRNSSKAAVAFAEMVKAEVAKKQSSMQR